jgi:hypothetical protein
MTASDALDAANAAPIRRTAPPLGVDLRIA